MTCDASNDGQCVRDIEGAEREGTQCLFMGRDTFDWEKKKPSRNTCLWRRRRHYLLLLSLISFFLCTFRSSLTSSLSRSGLPYLSLLLYLLLRISVVFSCFLSVFLLLTLVPFLSSFLGRSLSVLALASNGFRRWRRARY